MEKTFQLAVGVCCCLQTCHLSSFKHVDNGVRT